MSLPRLSRASLADHLDLESPSTRRLVRALRRVVLRAVPNATEAVKFRVLCYYHADAFFGAIGGNICMIELPRGRRSTVTLSFIHGARLPDPHRLLQGRAKIKRWVAVPDLRAATDPRLAVLIRAAAKLRPWD